MLKNYSIIIILVFVFFNRLFSEEFYSKNDKIQNSNTVFLLDSVKYLKFDKNQNKWNPVYFLKYSYNTKFLISGLMKFNHDTLQNPVYISNNLYSYNENNQLIEDITQTYIITDSSDYWYNKTRKVYIYDEKSNLFEEISQKYKESGVFKYWIDWEKYTYLYDTSNRIIQKIFSTYDEYFQIWYIKNRVYNVFDDIEHSLEIQNQTWDSTKKVWQNRNRTKNYYNNRNDIVEIWKSKGNSDSIWYPIGYTYSLRYNYNDLSDTTLVSAYLKATDSTDEKVSDSLIIIYDIDNKLFEKRYLMNTDYVNYSDSSWVYSWQHLYAYDINNNIIEILYNSFYYDEIYKHEYSYLKISPVNELLNTEQSDYLLILPNPAQDYINIIMNLKEGGNIKLYIYDLTLQNKMLIYNNYYDSGTHNFIYNSDNLPSGTYFVELQTDDIFTVKQLLIVK